ncbi:MAG: 2-hydroxy-6-oxo-2,4-heptadienoate hydrolase [Salinisphaeraceae bacterium]|nr:2-hydroxy-6-oxo-2,4-heptadienoate hydrolase [Salinisphaeraceae bacterium]
MSDNPEIGASVDAGGITTNYHDQGSGAPVVLIHGSGPGVTAWANWRLCIPELARKYRVLAPDILGFGYTERPDGTNYDMPTWLEHIVGFLDAMDLSEVDLVGNSFGGALSLALTIRHPERVRRVVLMGAAGTQFELTPGLDQAWGYTPSLENMRALLDSFAFNRDLVTDELAQLRYQASIRPGIQEAYSAMFPAPRQRWIKALASDDDDIRGIEKPTLIIHGREDRILPVSSSLRLHELIAPSELHVFGQCGHWTQIEHNARFNMLVTDFFAR